MGTRILEGVYDGTTPAAVMVDSVSGQAFGPIFEGPDAADDLTEFLDWMHSAELPTHETLGLTPEQMPSERSSNDPRVWQDEPLKKLARHWKQTRATA